MNSAGRKDDSGKLRLDLLPVEPLSDIAEVLTYGAKRYEPWNWSRGLSWMRMFGATLRHLYAWARGEDIDPETGLSHLAHAGCNILFLLWHERHRRDLDDRPCVNGDVNDR